jgi:parvulin-like peptidyl-prolyl isomerase
MDPSVRSWDCPNCGAANGSASSVPAPREASGPRLGGRGSTLLMTLLIAASIAVIVVVVLAVFFQSVSETTPSSPGASTSAPVTTSTLDHLCADVAPDMPLRVDSVRRTEAAVRADAKALKAQGDAEAADAAKDLAAALASLATALDTQGDTQTANAALQDALAALPC